jgi:hypothetical protein
MQARDYDTEHCLVVAEFWERLAVKKQRSHRFHMERLKLKEFQQGRR